ncbi:MAG: hypothetical protein J5934_02485 [Succinivibrio sp.]|nr:hypothetical protein [Succinivibrio sp.]
MKIKSHIREYEVFFEEDDSFLENLEQKKEAFYVIDKTVYELYSSLFATIPANKLYLLEAKEENKVIDIALDICDHLVSFNAKRNLNLISIGGGIVQDITGFVANIMYRGINWIFVPTTLLASCDSCIGSKTSLNYKKYKNLLGTFFPPSEIHIFTQFFNTLSEKDFYSGLGEVIKFNIMTGESGLSFLEKNIHNILKKDHEQLLEVVKRSLAFKQMFIEADEFDHGERIKLNFAHTFGHSIEVLSSYEIPHGTAVAIGMLMANEISEKRGWLSSDIARRCQSLLLPVIKIDDSFSVLDQPVEKYLEIIKKDKKQIASAVTAVLIRSFGEHSELIIDHAVDTKEISDAVKKFLFLYGNQRSLFSNKQEKKNS